ncbi:MAG: hypothetical protein NC416_10935 [Eubacterium sp.]|nr:hypothetical protein [Eubacterium sp.]
MEKDLQNKGYLCNPERFADLINGVMCSGKRILSPTDLSDMDSQTGFHGHSLDHGNNIARKKQRYRDLIKKAAFGVNFMVIGIENQEEVHYLMPLRSMAYDVAEYERQAAIINHQVKQCKDITSAEFLSGFTKESLLSPCVTLIVYYGDNWDGAKDLHDILDFTNIPQELKEVVNNYHIYICEVRKFENTDVFQTDIKQVFDCLRYAENPEKLCELVMNDPAYQQLEEDTYDLIAKYTKVDELMNIKQYKQKGRKVNMSGAFAEFIQMKQMEWHTEGLEQGIKALIETSMELESTQAATLDRLMTKLQLPRDSAEKYMEQYWH